ncbi:AbrB/MazE/SpoVT family DNA-binding domain-containing protein [Thermogladius sp.]|uniref:AbrB/MazE/SpoVT family DNA-binding domain-containing protein n=1 Tax=Thermogladius sp. TaxID=2023064 RepID=UPI003D0D60C9
MYRDVVRVHKKGIIVLPKSVREVLGIEEGTLLLLEVEGDRIVLKPLDLWERVWKCCPGSAEEAERELDFEEREYWEKREM